jgi:predicted nucleotidyltransferase
VATLSTTKQIGPAADERVTGAAAASATIAAIAARHPGLQLLLLHGSRARAEDHPRSDWDFAYLADRDFDPAALRADLVLGLGTDAIDLVNLERASGLLRYRAARDAVVLYQAAPEVFERFWRAAVTFWCDAAPLLRRGYEAILTDLDR